ncbi:MAG: hypothetical protein JEZ07_05650 [Phycisphaerae bacterium]|nr:hypothetical protein [Phycisphaerae bacterium]
MAKKKKKMKRVLAGFAVFIVLAAGALFGYKAITSKMLHNRIEYYREQGYPMDREEANEYFFKGVSDLPNKADMVREAFALIDQWDKDWQSEKADILPFLGSVITPETGQWMSDQQLEASLDFINDNMHALKLFGQVFDDPRECYLIKEVSINFEVVSMIWLKDMRFMAKVLALKSLVHLQQGDIGHGLVTIRQMLFLADLLNNDYYMINQIVSMSIRNLAVHMAERCLNLCQLNREELLYLYEVFDVAESQLPSMKNSYIMERARVSNALLKGRMRQNFMSNARQWDWKVYEMLTMDRDIIKLFDITEKYIGYAESLDYQSMKEARELVGDKPRDAFTVLFQRGYSDYMASEGLCLNDIMISSCGRVITDLREAQVAVCLELYCLDNGSFPDKIKQLTPEYVSEVPVDIFSGVELKYKKLDDGYEIYSVGDDMTDDGGDEEDDVVFLVKRQLN